MNITLYQTLEDRANPDDIEANGPFFCRIASAWLGKGYYFWDSHIELGHWWGKTIYGPNYIVCRANAFLDDSCWDLHGNGTHRIEFEQACNEIIEKKLSTREKLIVPQVISYLVNSGKFPFKAIRALAMESIANNKNNNFVVLTMRFKLDNISFFDIRPPVQLCLLNKLALSLRNYVVVYPADYVDQQYG